MKMQKRFAVAMLLLSLCVPVFANGTAESAAPAAEKKSEATVTSTEPVELTIAIIGKNSGFPEKAENDYVYQKILEKTGVSIKFQVIDDYYTALNVRIAGGDCPDLFQCDSLHMRVFAQNGDILDMEKYKDKELAPLMKWIGSTDTNAFRYEGDLYAVPKNYVNAMTYTLLNVRQDWLDKLGLSVPKTVDDLYDVAYAFTYKDPDGNGKNDTIGYSGKKPYGFDPIVNAYDTAFGNYVIIRDGKVTNSLLQPHMKEALAMCKKFVDAGVVDPDIFTTNPRDKAISGTLGLLSLEWSVMFKQSYVDQIRAVNPNARWSYFGPLGTKVGAAPSMVPIDPVETAKFLCVSSSISKAKLAGLFRLIDYLVSDEGSMLVNFGLQGVHWEYDDKGEAQMTTKAKEANYVATYQLLGREDKSYLAIKFKEAKDQIAYASTLPRFLVYNSLITAPDGFYLTDFENYVNQQLIAFVYGDRPISEYDAFIKELYDIYGFGDYLKACDTQMRAFGYIK